MSINDILLTALDIPELVKTNPDVFNWSKLSSYELSQLLYSNPTFYISLLKPHIDTLSKKITVLSRAGKHKKIRDTFALSDIEISATTNSQYVSLLNANFKTYMKKEKFEELSKSSQAEFFIKSPEYFLTNYGIMPKFTAANLDELSRTNAKFIDEHIKDFSDLSTSEYFWNKMISYDKKYEDIFLLNTKSLRTKTDVRSIFRRTPELIKKIDDKVLVDSKLTIKEWVMLTSTIMKDKPKIFNSFSFSDEIKELFKLELMVEVLSGKSNMSTRSKNAMANIDNDEN